MKMTTFSTTPTCLTGVWALRKSLPRRRHLPQKHKQRETSTSGACRQPLPKLSHKTFLSRTRLARTKDPLKAKTKMMTSMHCWTALMEVNPNNSNHLLSWIQANRLRNKTMISAGGTPRLRLQQQTTLNSYLRANARIPTISSTTSWMTSKWKKASLPRNHSAHKPPTNHSGQQTEKNRVTISISLKKTHLTVRRQPDTWKVTILTKGQMMKYCNKEKKHCSADRTQAIIQGTNHQLSAKTCPEMKHNNNVLRLQDLTSLSLNSMQQLWAGRVRSILE